MPGRNMVGDYRYAFQGQQKDNETGMEAFELRLWDSRIGRWLTTDPYGHYVSPYLGMGNNPISRVDPDGGFDWYTDENGNRTYDSRVSSQADLDNLGISGSYIGATFYDSVSGDMGFSNGFFNNFRTGESYFSLDEVVVGPSINSPSVLDNPTGNGVIRTQDGHGSGEYGASRDGGSRLHRGIDITTTIGQNITAPIDGVARNFVGNTSGIPMLQIFPTETTLGITRIDILYVNSLENTNPWQNYNITRGETVLGTAADLSELGYPNTITPHVHLQIHNGTELINPVDFFKFNQ